MRLPTAGMLLCAALCDSQTLAQTVFFDDFEGNALLPHWITPAPSRWEYNVSSSMLNVTSLLYPSNPQTGYNFAVVAAQYAPLGDFQMDVWMGWEGQQLRQRLTAHVMGSQGQGVASFGYVNDPSWGPGPLVYGQSNLPPQFMPAPPPGIHNFRIIRTGAEFQFYLNGNFFGVFLDAFGTPAAAISLEFVGPYPGQLLPLHIDRVLIVPSPAGLSAISGFLIVCLTRRRM